MYRIYEILEWVKMAATTANSYIWAVLNSEFGIAATGSFFGAVGGYIIVMVTNHRAEILSKIARQKIAINLTHSLFNVTYGLNQQHLHDLHQRYINGKKNFISKKNNNKNNPKIQEFMFYNKIISVPHIDFELINNQLLREIGFAGRAFLLSSALVSSLHSLIEALKYRQTVLTEINNISVSQKFDNQQVAHLYYGIKIPGPTGDLFYESYSDVMDAIKKSVESCIWFSKELVIELIHNTGEEAKKIIFKRPKIGSIDY